MFRFRKMHGDANVFKKVNSLINGCSSVRTKAKASSKLDMKCFVVERVTPHDHEAVVDLFHNSYFKTEPTLIGAGLANRYNAVLENKLVKSLEEGLSLMVRCRYDGSIAGVAVNSTLCPWDPDLQEDLADTCLCPKTAQLIRFYAFLTREPNLWCKYCEKKIFEVTYLATRMEDRGRGIGYTLLQKSLAHGKDMTYTLIRVDATSKHTQTICEQLGLQLEYELPYNRYCDPDGEVFIRPPPPHKSVRVYIYFPHSEEEANKKKKKYW